MTYKKFFALAEIIAATIFCIAEVVGCARLNSSISDLSKSSEDAVKSYIAVVTHGKQVFRDTYQTVPQHRKTVAEICESLKKIGNVCEGASNAIPDYKWLTAVREFPLKLYRPLGELEKSLSSSLEVLETLDEKKYDDIMEAFDNTLKSLKDAGKTISAMHRQLAHTVFIITGFMVFIALLVFGHGLASLNECMADV